jgi:hypothetical protein
MKHLAALTVIATLAAPSFAAAQSKQFVNYSIENKSTKVTGRFSVDGYSTAQMMKFMSQDCRGKVGNMALVGKARKKKGVLQQKFQATCEGGLSSKYKGKRASFSIVKQADGRNLAYVLGSDGLGNVGTTKSYR